MLRSHRRAHRVLWLALLIALPNVIVLAWQHRKVVPTVEQLPIEIGPEGTQSPSENR